MDLNSSQSPDKEIWSLKAIERVTLILGLVFLVATLYLRPTLPVFLGLVSGVLIGWLNFRLLGRLVSKLINKSQIGQSKSAGVLIIKIFLLIIVVGVLILGVKVNPLAFILGFSANILAILVEALRVMF